MKNFTFTTPVTNLNNLTKNILYIGAGLTQKNVVKYISTSASINYSSNWLSGIISRVYRYIQLAVIYQKTLDDP
ncbi:hypothetical protein H6798_02140 [Candidatus Nomurabacteria bacterium]|nr:hypothetical protein [Candidatus Nomurabacteria bacterium]